jgi:hypothetical protein
MKLTSIAFTLLMCVSCSSSPPMQQIPPPVNKHVVTITEFEGDRLGESIETFRSRYPKTSCKPFQYGKDLTQACTVSEMSNIAGVQLKLENQDCYSPKPVSCYQYMYGIFNPSLDVIRYRVKRDYLPLITAALYNKYGEPSSGNLGDDLLGPSWSGPDTVLSVTQFIDALARVKTINVTLSTRHRSDSSK